MKKTLLLMLLSASTSFGQTIYDNLLIHYKMDCNANDYSGNDYHGSANATLTTDRNGNPNSAYHFDGIGEYYNSPQFLDS